LEKARSSSTAGAGLFCWARAMIDYFKVFTETKPLRIELEKMNTIVAEKTEELKLKKADL